jgi:hypothetical protein
MRRFHDAFGVLVTRRRRWLSVPVLALGASVLVIALASADNIGGFEIDADHTTPGDALYSGNNGGNDWAQGASNQGIFRASTSAPHTAAADCYGSNIDKNPSAVGPSALICDGNSDSNLDSLEPEQNIVSPSGKSPDDVWPVKPGNVRPKNDFSHAYVHANSVDSPCDSDTLADDVVLHLGGHVGDNEGSHFWGYEFMANPPSGFGNLKANDGSSFDLDFNRQVGDILVSFTVPGNTSEPVELELFKVTGFNADGSAIFSPAGALAGCPAGQSQGFSLLRTNNFDDVKAPPWNVPACDPTADNSANTCRLANGTTPAEDLLPPRDFAEASVDLTAFGISPCFTNVVFSSRSSHVLDGADVQDVGGADFPLCGAKSGTKFHDRNANGVRDAGEPGLAGWKIKLYKDADGDNVLEDSDDGTTGNGAVPFRPAATTGANGSYSFANLPNGDYIVCEVQQAGWTQSLPNAGTADKANCSIDPTLGATGRGFTMTGVDHTGNDFGNFRNGTKSGTKFNDLNGDGDRDSGEPGLAGVQIHLFGTDGRGTAIDRHTTTAVDNPATTTVDETGRYSFSVPPGAYTVCESVPAGFTQSFPTSGASCSGHSGASGLGYAITLTSGQVDSGNDFGNFRNATKSGTKFIDLNGDGDRDTGEPGLAGVQIHLFGTDGRGNPVHNHATTVTDNPATTGVNETGQYSISAPPGTYTVCETVPIGYTQSFPSSGADCSVHTGIPGSKGYAITLTSGQLDSGNDFGNFQSATISGVKFKDADAGGDKDGGEIGLGGWEIHLFGTDGRGNLVHDHATTAADGTYSFSVAPGTYTLCETVSGQTGWVQSFPTTGADCTGHTHGGAITPGAIGQSVTVTSGGTAGDRDFGNAPLSRARITFESLADLPGGSDATKATSISCDDANGASVGSATNSNSLTTDDVKTNQSSLTCTITFVDP